MFAFSRGCDRYEHAKVYIPRIALPDLSVKWIKFHSE